MTAPKYSARGLCTPAHTLPNPFPSRYHQHHAAQREPREAPSVFRLLVACQFHWSSSNHHGWTAGAVAPVSAGGDAAAACAAAGGDAALASGAAGIAWAAAASLAGVAAATAAVASGCGVGSLFTVSTVAARGVGAAGIGALLVPGVGAWAAPPPPPPATAAAVCAPVAALGAGAAAAVPPGA